MMPVAAGQPPQPTLVYAARFYAPRPKVRTYSHLYQWRVGQTARGTRLTSGACDDTEPKAAPDGRTVFFVRVRDTPTPSVCALSLKTKQVRTLFSGMAESGLYNLSVSPNGKTLLVKQVVYGHTRPVPNAPDNVQWFAIPVKAVSKATSRLVWRDKSDEDTSAAWESDSNILLLHPPHYTYHGFDRSDHKISGRVDIVSLADLKAPRKLVARASDYSLENDMSPDRKFVLSQPDTEAGNPKKSVPARLIRIADGKTMITWSVAPDERLHWLTPRRLVGVLFKEKNANASPVQFRLYSIPLDAGQKNSVPLAISPDASPVYLSVNTDPMVNAALKKNGLDLAYLYEVEPARGKGDGFLLGSPWHKEEKGVRFWINAQTGQATQWSKCGTPHPSPDGKYFWSQPGSSYAKIGKRHDGNAMAEAVVGLYMASYDSPAHLIPIVSGTAFVYGADWLHGPLQ